MSLHGANSNQDNPTTRQVLRETASIKSFTSIFASRKLPLFSLSNNRPPSVSSQSSSWSRAVVAWFPRAIYINNGSTNTSTSTVVQYPVRDPGRLQKLKGSSGESGSDNNTSVQNNKNATDDTLSSLLKELVPFDETLVADDLTFIRAFIVENAAVLDDHFEFAASAIMRLDMTAGRLYEDARLEDKLAQETRLELESLDEQSRNSVSLLIWIYVLSLSNIHGYGALSQAELIRLYDPQPQSEGSFVSRLASVLTMQPDHVTEISKHLLKNILGSFTECLNSDSVTLLYARLYCGSFMAQFDDGIDFAKASFAALDIAQVKNLAKASPKSSLWILVPAAYSAYTLGHYHTAQDLYIIILDLCKTFTAMEDLRRGLITADCHLTLALCLYYQNQHQEALRHAQEVLTFYSEHADVSVLSSRIKKTQDWIQKIEAKGTKNPID